MSYRYTAVTIALVLLTATSLQAQQDGARNGKLVAIGKGATTPLCKRMAAIADALSGVSGPPAVKAIPDRYLGPPFSRVWSPATASQLTPELIRHVAADRYRLEAQRELESQKAIAAPGTFIPTSQYDARAEEIGVPQLRTAMAEGRLVVEQAIVDLAGTGKASTALHVGIRTDAQQAHQQIDWTIHVVPDPDAGREESANPSLASFLRSEALFHYSDVIRYGARDYMLGAGMATRYFRPHPGGFVIATMCDGAARLMETRRR